MPIQGRDWNRRHEEPIHPPSSESAFTTWLIVAILVSTAAVYAVRHHARSVSREAPKVVLEAVRPAPESREAEPSNPPVADTQPPPQVIYRCDTGGSVVYGDQMRCAGSLSVTRVPAATSDDVSPRLTDYQQEMLRSADERIAQDAETARVEMASMVVERASSHQVRRLGR